MASNSQAVTPQYLGLRNAIGVALTSYVGTALEFYDFLVFGFVAATIAPLFFPSSNPMASLLSTLAVFWFGFFTRPLGAIVFGHLGDTRFGRKNTLVVSIFMMGLVSLATGLLPTYASIGIWAAVGLMVMRLLQGLSVGGEFGGATSFAMEHAPPKRRSLFVSIVQMSNNSLIATAVLAIVSGAMTRADFAVYGWRWMFYIGFVIALLGFVFLLAFKESPIYTAAKAKKALDRVPVKEVFSKYWKTLLITWGIAIGGTVGVYTSGVFAVTYLVAFIKTSVTLASTAVAVGSLFAVIMCPIYGFLADKFGRKPFMIFAYGGMLVFSYPFFLLLATGNPTLIYLAFIIFFIIFAGNVPAITLITEIWPTRVRYSGLSLAYQVPTSVAGGVTPLLATYLITATHYNLAPIYWLAIAAAIALISSLIIKETRDIDVAQ